MTTEEFLKQIEQLQQGSEAQSSLQSIALDFLGFAGAWQLHFEALQMANAELAQEVAELKQVIEQLR